MVLTYTCWSLLLLLLSAPPLSQPEEGCLSFELHSLHKTFHLFSGLRTRPLFDDGTLLRVCLFWEVPSHRWDVFLQHSVDFLLKLLCVVERHSTISMGMGPPTVHLPVRSVKRFGKSLTTFASSTIYFIQPSADFSAWGLGWRDLLLPRWRCQQLPLLHLSD